YTQESGNLSSNGIRLDSGRSTLNNSDKFELYQNVPNPFNNSTVIGFNLPETDVMTFKLFDLTGKLIYQTTGHYAKGYNTINLDVSTFNINGVLYYQLDSNTHSATRKMIVIN
ncbi:MAG: T9SS type A sorting domain-containing protein, partial [Saprospiraceae bacterium]|nr:T9SS type A sorting domain-containing protein [Saprospiraceae bacterium]